jgi:uncharacterized repeat protein (TIGR03847 family)
MSSFDFRETEFLTVGTLGPRGERVFYLQGRGDHDMGEPRLVSLRLEKQQVAALADYLARVLEDLPEGEVGPTPEDLGLREPVIAEFTVASLGVAYSNDDDRLIVMAEEMLEEEDDDESDQVPDHVRWSLRREQVIGLVARAREVVAAGRPPCEYCGRPVEPRNGDWCACSN